MGVVTKSIGTSGRNYSTLQAWEDALPANLVSDGNYQVGECYNDSEFAAALSIAGEITDSTHTITLKCATGHGFRDNVNVQTNALTYNQGNGVGQNISSGSSNILITGVNYVYIDGIQMKNNANATCFVNNRGYPNFDASSYAVLTNVIMKSWGVTVFVLGGVGSTISNSLIIGSKPFSGSSLLSEYYVAPKCYNCTFVYDNGGSYTAAISGIGGGVYQNCAFYSGGAVYSGSAPTFTTCYCDSGSPPSGCTTAAFDTSQFVSVTTDFRIPISSAFKDHGTTDSTNAAYDIANTARPQGAAYDVGCWEYKSTNFNCTVTPSVLALTLSLKGVSISLNPGIRLKQTIANINRVSQTIANINRVSQTIANINRVKQDLGVS